MNGDIVTLNPGSQDLDGDTRVVATGASTAVTVNGTVGSTDASSISAAPGVSSVGAVGDLIVEDGATLEVTGNVNAGVIGVDSSSASAGATFGGNIDAGIVTILHDEGGNTETITLDGGAAQTVNGDIIADSASDAAAGDITVTGASTDVTFEGTIGSTNVDLTGITGVDSAQSLESLTVASDAVATLNADADFNGAVNITSTAADTFTNNADLTVGGAFDIVGTFNNTANATAEITGDVTSGGTIANAGTLTLNGANNAATINNNGTLEIGTQLTNTGTIDLSATSGETATVDLGALTDGQTAIAGGTADLTGSARVLLNPALASAETVIIADNTAATTNGNLAANVSQLTVANALRQVTVDTTTNPGAVTATIGAANTAEQTAAALGVSAANGAKLNQAGNEAIAGNFNTAGFTGLDAEVTAALSGSAADAQTLAEQLGDATATAGAAANAAVSAFAAGGQSIGNRLASLRGGETSVAAGNGVASENVWFEAHASISDQDARKGAQGFEADTYGGTIGYDNAVGNNSRMGVAFTYSQSDIDGDSAANVNQDVNNFILNLYGEKAMGKNFVNGSVHFGIQDADIAMESAGLVGRGTGDYSNEQFGAQFEFGRTVALGEGRLIPTAGLSWTRVGSDSFDLSDGATTVTESFSSKDQVQGKLGARYEQDYQTDNGGLFRPAVYGNFGYDFASDEVTTTRNFGGVLINDQQAEVAEESVGFGAAFTYETPDRMTAVQVGYDGEYRDEYLSHSGKVRLSFRF